MDADRNQAAAAGAGETDSRTICAVVAATGAFGLTLRNTDASLADARNDGAVGVREVAGRPFAVLTRIDDAVAAGRNNDNVLAGRATGLCVRRFALFSGFYDPISALRRVRDALALSIAGSCSVSRNTAGTSGRIALFTHLAIHCGITATYAVDIE